MKANFVLAVIFFAVAAFVDVIDGAVARVQGKTTKKGISKMVIAVIGDDATLEQVEKQLNRLKKGELK